MSHSYVRQCPKIKSYIWNGEEVGACYCMLDRSHTGPCFFSNMPECPACGEEWKSCDCEITILLQPE